MKIGCKTIPVILFVLAAFFLTAPSAGATTRIEAAQVLDEFRNFFVDFQQAPDNAIPGDLLAECYGVIIMSQFRAGFIFGGEYGEGVVLLHDRVSGEWSAPAFVRSASGNWGLQAGGQQTDAIILIMNQEGVDMLLNSRFTIGVDASASAGPVGRNVAAAVGPGTSLLTYARARGLFAGATLGGSAILNNDGRNAALYGRPIGVREIIEGRVPVPQEAFGLINALKSYALTNHVPSSDPMRSQPMPPRYSDPNQPPMDNMPPPQMDPQTAPQADMRQRQDVMRRQQMDLQQQQDELRREQMEIQRRQEELRQQQIDIQQRQMMIDRQMPNAVPPAQPIPPVPSPEPVGAY